MSDWILTLPQYNDWGKYKLELEAVRDGKEVMNYRLPYKPKAVKGDRCFVLYRGIVRGWMAKPSSDGTRSCDEIQG